ncbi:vacuolar protein-sorting-associated protein 36 [Chrysoperla carnea]|uniref:vacuolar protein-sorting-associated protein 36 n=1 Tax=Chrysoperla carnea TaxID=189513 RepID=UPI001D05CFDA|nr:vacuolar protein-sorting-associated protein 36 [Chrysoperla carnea]
MDRFEYVESRLQNNEELICRERNVKIYDGDEKTTFEHGEVSLTSHRILWSRSGDVPRGSTCLSLALNYVIFIEDEVPGSFSFSRSHKIILHLSEPLPGKHPGPSAISTNNFIKLSFKDGLINDFTALLNRAIQERRWEILPEVVAKPAIKTRTGIVGIERSIQKKQEETDKNISIAFQDLSKLMTMAKDMVQLSRNISNKIRERQGDITEDETIRFKSYLMGLGIEDPVTRGEYKNEDQYHKNLARQISTFLTEQVREVGGMMALADVYCRVNRARGLELLSPEDLLNACRLLEPLNQPIRLHEFESGVKVIQLQSNNDASIVKATSEALEIQSLTAEELAQSLGISVLLAKQRLLITEKYGEACRDDSIEGLRFYPNKFLKLEN